MLEEKIVKLRKEGKTYGEIGEILKCAKSTISYHCNKEKNKKNILNDIEREIIKERENGKTRIELIEIFKDRISQHELWRVCKDNGLSYLNRLNEHDIKEIKETYDELKSVKKVSKKLGYSIQTVRKNVELFELSSDQLTKNRVKSVIEWRKRTKIKLVEYKGGQCVRCGYKKSTRALSFHHLDPSEKDFSISGKSWSFERLKKEVDKCILVCRNCHSEIHEEIENNK